MSEGVFITKNGFRATKWDPEIRQYVDKEIHSIYHELRTHCQIEEGVTLRDIINIVANDEDLCYLISNYSWCNVKAFQEEVNKPTPIRSGLLSIQISRSMSLWNYSGTDSIEDGIDISGEGPDKDGKIIDNWAIELTPVNEMADVPVKLDLNMEIWDNREVSPSKKIATVETWYSLLDILSEIFYEISFHGSPDQRNEFTLDFKQTVADVKSRELKVTPLNLDEKIQ